MMEMMMMVMIVIDNIKSVWKMKIIKIKKRKNKKTDTKISNMKMKRQSIIRMMNHKQINILTKMKIQVKIYNWIEWRLFIDHIL